MHLESFEFTHATSEFELNLAYYLAFIKEREEGGVILVRKEDWNNSVLIV